MPSFLAPRASISPADLDRGVRNLLLDAAFATAIGALNSGVVLLALALHIGASNVTIGILAAIPLFTQLLQAPAVRLVETLRTRRLISVVCVFVARLALPLYALVPFISDPWPAVSMLIGAALLHYGLNSVASCSWNSWMRDLIPSERLGLFFARRNLYGTAVSAVATIAAALALQAAAASHAAGNRIFAALYLFGFFCGLFSTVALARVPEPVMAEPNHREPLGRLLYEPLRDRNFRNMLRYLASWQFAVNLATPFFTVYFVRELGMSMSFVLILAFVSQVANVVVVRGWGALSDRFSNKSVLLVATPMFIACIAAMAAATQFETATGRALFLTLLHVIMGAASAGVGLASGNIVIKLSPPGAATSYMATNALVCAIAAGIAPIIGGWTSDFFARRHLAVVVQWSSPRGVSDLLNASVTHWQFFFLISALLGLYTLHRLTVIEESGTIAGREVVGHVVVTAGRALRNVSTVAGMRVADVFPGGDLIRLRERRRFILEGVARAWSSLWSRPAMGSLLEASFPAAPADPTMEDLLSQLDALPASPPAGSR